LLSAKRPREAVAKPKQKEDLRSEFEKDYHRIIGSASFRRLQDKTQVFPLDKSDFIRTRLTHSLEVSSYGKSLGQNIGEYILTYIKDPDFTWKDKEEICNILECAGLIHDIGNPPFGHFGESVIRDWFKRNLPIMKFKGETVENLLTEQMREDFYHFEGNAQALRLVTKLHYLVDEHGMNLTYALLHTIVKYPVSSVGIDKTTGNIKDKKMGYYYADKDIFESIVKETGTDGKRHPLTFILEAADDIAYKTADIEDAYVKGFISYYQLKEELRQLQESEPENPFRPLEKLEHKYESGVKRGVSNPEEYAVKNWIVQAQGFLINCATYGFTSNYNAIMEGTYGKDIFCGTYGEGLMHLLGDMAYRRVFTTPSIYKMEVAESVIMDFLMDKFVKAVLYYDTDVKLNDIDKRVVSFISENYKSAYHKQAEGKDENEKLYLRLLLVTDYICGMTDSYAKRLYQELNAVI
ncbi:MAG: deoxyguanosinetriphosphate triphosphohydrolase, partial [Faecalimonas sp.]|nr:deoxyguanosinetriphosphate triphosphohydrolase [Faecalimonas sp.]